MSTPFNLDSSDDVRYEIREEGNTTYLDLKADEEWLKDDEREYPVRIDPSLVIQGTYQPHIPVGI
ncbi:hypothetical protein [Desmospora profundinema]|uniref:Uncharacterized protein n=1 Tax=Desmospora profundinema TaxID=1571184 RepID=A0ABU1IT38_9BACL|nr:hypothetical protein [Desmospora profundinema]MDR6227364.1 hypothetical protein [Desmospora profundinema]